MLACSPRLEHTEDRPHVCFFLPRGGTMPGRWLCSRLGVDSVSVDALQACALGLSCMLLWIRIARFVVCGWG